MKMAPNYASKICSLVAFIAFLSYFASFGSCISLKSFNHTLYGFQGAVATWYGDAHGAGSGGACGFENDVANPPYSALISAGNDALFKGGKGCGECYQVKCTENAACSGSPITVTITDQCPGACNNDPVHFDLSGTAFGNLAKPGQADQLRNAGRINIVYQRVQCNYPGTKIVFKVASGSNSNYLQAAIEYENGDGDLSSVEIQPSGASNWSPMQEVFGAAYKYDIPQGTKGPFSFRLTSGQSQKTLVLQNAIPVDWTPGKSYQSSGNY